MYANQTISTPTTLGPAVPRENITKPDLGYGYDPMDYVFGGTFFNANLTFTPGTAVGWFKGSGTDYGIRMGNSQVASFQGTAASPVWWVRGNTVQEQGGSVAWPGAGATGGLVGEAGSFSLSPKANLFFTHCSILGFGDGGRLNHFQDDGGYCDRNRGAFGVLWGCLWCYAISCYFTNCLLDRVLLAQVQGRSGNAFTLTNCTFHGGSLILTPNTAIQIAVHDSAFDGTSITASGYGTPSYASYGYNAFTSAAGELPISGGHDQIVTGGFNWQHSWFGYYYLPSGSPLIARGDVAANVVGLYHFTTQVSQVPEDNAVVDIGYHYVATDSNGNPLDTIVPGIPDYLSYPNGSPPVITTQPASQSAQLGYAATFRVAAVGSPTLSYQWMHNNTSIPNATHAAFSIASVQTTDAGSYSVAIANSFGPVTSSTATMAVTTPVFVNQVPNGAVSTSGDGLSDDVALSLGLDPFNAYTKDPTHTYNDAQWRLTAVTGETGKYATIQLVSDPELDVLRFWPRFHVSYV